MSLSLPPYPPVIGICGDFECGKDEVAKILVKQFQYTRVAFADFLREQVYNYVVNQAGYPSDFPDEIVKIIRDHCRDPYAIYRKPTSRAIHNLLQYIGTDYFRTVDENYWVDKMRAYVKPLLEAGRRVAIPDMRHPNEVGYVREEDGDTWRVIRPIADRPQNEFGKHPSERALDGVQMDLDILNDGTLADLAGKVGTGMTLAKSLHLRQQQAA